MYDYIQDKEFLKRAQSTCSEILSDLTDELFERDISAQFFLVGSGGRNMVTQNARNPIDFDYNLNIQKCDDFDDCRAIKETVRKAFNKVLNAHSLAACEDSTSSLTSKRICFNDEPNIEFTIDLCIVTEDTDGFWHRLIHQKTGYTANDAYFWNKAPNSKDVKAKSDRIKKSGNWLSVRDEYLKLKNNYLRRNDHNHPSFICYIEAVNNVYNSLKQKRMI